MTGKPKVEILIDPKPKKSKKIKKPVASDESSLKRKEDYASDIKRRIVLLLVKVAFFGALVYVVFFVIFGITRMKDFNMYPAVKDGDLLIYYRLEHMYGNGDIIVATMGNTEMVARIIASPGQELNLNEAGELTIDGQPSTFQSFYETLRADVYGFRYPYKVSPDCYFVLNDYRSNTNDSRAFGEICQNKIKGRLITKIQIRDL